MYTSVESMRPEHEGEDPRQGLDFTEQRGILEKR
jgi:hypothetical protein